MSDDTNRKALDYALRAVGYRRLTEKALYKKLMEKGFTEEQAAYAMAKLVEYGGINDEEYAAAMTRSMVAKGYGKKRIQAKLREKGVEKEQSEESLDEYETNWAAMQKYIRSKIRTDDPDRATLQKVSNGLFLRGFSWDEIRKALQNYNNEEDYDL